MKLPLFFSLWLLPVLAAAADPVTPPAKPAKPTPTPEELFARLDKDKNGSLNLDEFRGSFKKRPADEKLSLAFRKRDSDANGKLTLAEFAAGIPKEEVTPGAVEQESRSPSASGSKLS